MKKQKIYWVAYCIALFSLLALFCFNERSNYQARHDYMSYIKEQGEDTKREDPVTCDGDIEVYEQFCSTYNQDSVGTLTTGRMLTYSFIMSNKYSYAPANYMVYRILTDFYQVNGIEEDEAMRELTTHYLQKGAELGDERCLSVLKRIDEMD